MSELRSCALRTPKDQLLSQGEINSDLLEAMTWLAMAAGAKNHSVQRDFAVKAMALIQALRNRGH
jgi:hypothetical protein